MKDLVSLTAHLERHKQLLNSPSVPAKHAHRPDAYRAYLKSEVTRTQRKLDSLKPAKP
jgi:hypothetical protein